MSLIYVETLEDFEKVILSDEHTPLVSEFVSFINPNLEVDDGYIFKTSTNKNFLINFRQSNHEGLTSGYFVDQKIKLSNYYYETSQHSSLRSMDIIYDIIINKKKPSVISYSSHGDIKEKKFLYDRNKIYKDIEYRIDGSTIERFNQTTTDISPKCVKRDFNNKLVYVDYYINNQVVKYSEVKNIFPHLKDLEKIKNYDLKQYLTPEEIKILEMIYI